MSINTKQTAFQQPRFQKHAQQSDSYRFFDLLTSPTLLRSVETLLPEHRERQFPPTETLSMFLAQALNKDRSCQRVVNDAAVTRLMGGLPPCSTATGGYCRARQRLPLAMISGLVRETAQVIDRQIPDEWRWRGKRVHLIDGTTISMPDTVDNQNKYPQQGGQKEGLGFPLCRLLGVICMSSSIIRNAAISPYKGKGADEHTLLRSVLDTFVTGDVVVGDALFGSYFLMATLLEKGVDVVFEQMGTRRSKTDFRRGKSLGPKDHVIVLQKPKKRPDWMTQNHYDSAPKELQIRELSVGKKTLITTFLNHNRVSKKELGSLYKRRWDIEVDFRNIKTTMGMETLTCKTSDMAEKEMWVYFLAYNLIRLMMVQSALLADILPRQISFKHTVQLWLAWGRINVNVSEEISISEALLFGLIAQRRVGNRPGRVEPRAVKRRPKQMPLLTKPRALAIQNIKRYGHR